MLHFCCRSSEAGVLGHLPQVYGNQIWQLFSMQNIDFLICQFVHRCDCECSSCALRSNGGGLLTHFFLSVICIFHASYLFDIQMQHVFCTLKKNAKNKYF